MRPRVFHGEPWGGQRGERGSVTAWIVLVPAMMLLLCGLSLDLWLATSVRARLSAMADEAAAAAATAVMADELREGDLRLDPAVAAGRARQVLAGHGDADHMTGHDIRVTADRVTVTVEGRSDLLLLRMVGPTTIDITVTGAALAAPAAGP